MSKGFTRGDVVTYVPEKYKALGSRYLAVVSEVDGDELVIIPAGKKEVQIPLRIQAEGVKHDKNLGNILNKG